MGGAKLLCRFAVMRSRLHLVRDTFESLELGDLAAQVFEFHFFQDGNFSEWEGPETLKQLYAVSYTHLL